MEIFTIDDFSMKQSHCPWLYRVKVLEFWWFACFHVFPLFPRVSETSDEPLRLHLDHYVTMSPKHPKTTTLMPCPLVPVWTNIKKHLLSALLFWTFGDARGLYFFSLQISSWYPHYWKNLMEGNIGKNEGIPICLKIFIYVYIIL